MRLVRSIDHDFLQIPNDSRRNSKHLRYSYDKDLVFDILTERVALEINNSVYTSTSLSTSGFSF